MNGNGTTAPGLALPGETPWRTITLGETLAPIVETTVSFDVVKPLYEASGNMNTAEVPGAGLLVWMEVRSMKSNYVILISLRQWDTSLYW